MKSSLIAILGLICMAHAVTLREVSCQAATSTASYNLNPLKLPLGEFYNVNDFRTVEGVPRNISLYFNFCADLEPPQFTKELCNTTGPIGNEKSGPAASFTEDHKEHICYHSSGEMDVTKPSNSIKLRPLDATNPADGVELILLNGEKYGSYFFETHINVSCTGEDQEVTVPSKGVVFITEGYKVELVIKSPYGCPTECVSGRSLCGSHGICSFDLNSRKSHCYCNDGYTGAYCTTKNVFSWFNMTILFVVLVVLLAVLILGFAIRIDARMNIDALNSLEKQFNQLGQLA